MMCGCDQRHRQCCISDIGHVYCMKTHTALYIWTHLGAHLLFCFVLLGTTPSAAFKNSSSNVGCGNQLVESWRGNFTERQSDNDGQHFFLGASSRSID